MGAAGPRTREERLAARLVHGVGGHLAVVAAEAQPVDARGVDEHVPVVQRDGALVGQHVRDDGHVRPRRDGRELDGDAGPLALEAHDDGAQIAHLLVLLELERDEVEALAHVRLERLGALRRQIVPVVHQPVAQRQGLGRLEDGRVIRPHLGLGHHHHPPLPAGGPPSWGSARPRHPPRHPGHPRRSCSASPGGSAPARLSR